MATLEKDDLRKILEAVFNEIQGDLKQLGVQDKDSLINQVVENLTGKIDPATLKSAGVHKALGIALISQAVTNKFPGQGFDYSILFADKSNVNANELKNELIPELKKLFGLTQLNPKLTPKATAKKIDEYAEKLAAEITSRFMNAPAGQDNLAQNNVFNALIVEMYLRSIYGGNLPSREGDIDFPVLEIIGEFLGRPQEGPNQANPESLMEKRTSYDTRDADYQGFEEDALARIVSFGGVLDTVEEVLQSLSESSKEDYRSPSPFNMKNTPQGYK